MRGKGEGSIYVPYSYKENTNDTRMSLTEPRNDREQMMYGLGILDGIGRARQVIEEDADSPFKDSAELLFVLEEDADSVVKKYKPFVERESSGQ